MKLDDYLKRKRLWWSKMDDPFVHEYILVGFKDKESCCEEIFSGTFKEALEKSRELAKRFGCEYVDVDIFDSIDKSE